MKTKNVKLMTSLLSVGALGAILIPTMTLTSCSASANPYVSEFTGAAATVNGTGVQFTAKMGSNNMMQTATIKLNGTDFNNKTFDDEWAKLRKNENYQDENKKPLLPSTIFQLDKDISNGALKSEVQKLVNNKNTLTTAVAVINNLKSIFENYNSLFISKNYDIANMVQRSKFIKYFVSGLNNYKSYARLWLSDISFNVNLSFPNDVGATKTKEEYDNLKKTPIAATISGIKLTYKWYELNDNGSTPLDTLEKIKPYNDNLPENQKLKEEDLTFSFTSNSSMNLYFDRVYNGIKDNNYLSTGLVIPTSSMPLSLTFASGESQEQSRKKADWFNKEVLGFLKGKLFSEANLNNLLSKIGYLKVKDLPENGSFTWTAEEQQTYLTSGAQWLESLMGGKLPPKPTTPAPNPGN